MTCKAGGNSRESSTLRDRPGERRTGDVFGIRGEQHRRVGCRDPGNERESRPDRRRAGTRGGRRRKAGFRTEPRGRRKCDVPMSRTARLGGPFFCAPDRGKISAKGARAPPWRFPESLAFPPGNPPRAPSHRAAATGRLGVPFRPLRGGKPREGRPLLEALPRGLLRTCAKPAPAARPRIRPYVLPKTGMKPRSGTACGTVPETPANSYLFSF